MKKILFVIIGLLLITIVIASENPTRIFSKNNPKSLLEECASTCQCNTDPSLCWTKEFTGDCDENGIFVTTTTCFQQCKDGQECFQKSLGESCNINGITGVCSLAGGLAKSGRMICDTSGNFNEARNCEVIQEQIDKSLIAQIGNIECDIPAYCQDQIKLPEKSCDPECGPENTKIIGKDEIQHCEISINGEIKELSEMEQIRSYLCYGETNPVDTSTCKPPYGTYISKLFNCLNGHKVTD